MVDPRDLSCATFANGWTMWHYRTSDHLRKVLEPDYFMEVSYLLSVGDFICVNTSWGAVDIGGTILMVTKSTANYGRNVVSLKPTSGHVTVKENLTYGTLEDRVV